MENLTSTHATSADGTKIAYWCFGRGKSILFVHGLSGSHVNWQPVAERLSGEFTACTMDRRGRGESGDCTPYAFEREIEDVAAVAATLGRVVVFAHSLAGPLALEAARTSDAVRAVILYEAWASPLSEMPRDVLEGIERLVSLGRYEEAFNYGDPPEEIEQTRLLADYVDRVATAHTFPREIRGWERYWQEHPVEDERWRAIEKPVLLLCGERDRNTMEPPAQRFAEHLPHATIKVLAGQGHTAYNEAPEVVAEVVRSWLGNLNVARDR